jgi:NAD(P)-dependent dehydrogenase (short-subunit alcohol dehydrogenase family)
VNKLSIASFTNLGYSWHARRFDDIDADLSGRTAVVTGGTGGLGFEAARQLAQLNASVVIVGRNQEKLDRAANIIGPLASTMRADLSLMEEVRELASRVLEEQDALDVLINNVGVLNPERSETVEGLEKTFAINLAGQFLFTNLLLPRIIDSAPSRIINVTSGGMYSQRIRPEDLQFREGTYSGSTAYARTKRGQVILTEEWAKRLNQTDVVVHSMHPGWSATAGVENSLPLFYKVMRPLLRTPEQGADTIAWLAAAQKPAESSGLFWFDREPAPTHLMDATRETQAERDLLWEMLADATGSDFPTRSVEKRVNHS